MKKNEINPLFGGVIVTLMLACGSARAQTVWSHATDGAWSDAAAWTAGVPDFNAVLITNAAAAYTVSVSVRVWRATSRI